MPSVSIEFDVRHVLESEPAYGSSVSLTDLATVWAIAELGFTDGARVGHGNARARIEVRAPEGDPRIQQVFEILARFGFRPCARTLPARQTTTNSAPSSDALTQRMKFLKHLCSGSGAARMPNALPTIVIQKTGAEWFPRNG